MIKSEILNIEVPHPGFYLKEAIEEIGITQSEFAIRTDMTAKTVSSIINEECGITFETALKLSLFFQTSVDFWMNLQTGYDLYIQSQKEEKEIKEEWDLLKLIDKNFLKKCFNIEVENNNKKTVIKAVRENLMVTKLSSLKRFDLFSFCKTAIRKNQTEKEMFLRNAWISAAYKYSQRLKVEQFDKKKLESSIKLIKTYTTMEPEIATVLLKNKLAECGIKYVELPYLKGSNVSGVTRWLASENCVMIAINDCGKDADKIWFTLFHEIGHAMFNHKRHLTISLQKNTIIDDEEREANRFAEDALIDRKRYYKFVQNNDFSLKAIESFAESENVASFVVIGRLQKDRYIGFDRYQNHKIKYEC